MSDYTPPLKDMLFNLHHVSGFGRVLEIDRFADFDFEIVDQVVDEAGKFAAEVLGPINMPGDLAGCTLVDKGVVAAPGFADAYAQFVENGWQGIDVTPDYGGMGLPGTVAAAAVETRQAACLSFSLAPMLTSGAIAAIEAHGSEDIRNMFLPKLASGEWLGTMNLTEPQAGSDLSVVATRAVPEGDHYRVTGSKIFITWGDQDFTENVAHLVLARLPDAPEGVRGMSLFVVPKFLINTDGSNGDRNDVFVAGIEHKLGIHASPTCVMSFGEGEGAVGYLVGEENKGLACMFTMMNHARIGVGLQGLGISERAYQLALQYAKVRVQGRAPGVDGRATIIHHPDVRRMLLLMKSQIEAMRASAYAAAVTDDVAHYSTDTDEKYRAGRSTALLTPVIKAWLTEVAQEVTSLGVQIHGGMGYVEETGAAQHMRDARILTIYEGTTGIQANDFAGRKILGDDGLAVSELIDEMRSIDGAMASDDRLAAIRNALTEAVDRFDASVDQLKSEANADRNAAGSASVNLLMLAGTTLGGYQMARSALAIVSGASADDASFADAKLQTANFYAAHVMPRTATYASAADAGSAVLMDMPEVGF
ncbi:MAG: acyl-CoA dehydrogenase [Gammaproteobacteria bacterium]|nr:acyl-CoA dehydrogenase [Gammaproteobacteria bacterium]